MDRGTKHELSAKATATGPARVNNRRAEIVRIDDLDVHTFTCSCGKTDMDRDEAADHIQEVR